MDKLQEGSLDRICNTLFSSVSLSVGGVSGCIYDISCMFSQYPRLRDIVNKNMNELGTRRL